MLEIGKVYQDDGFGSTKPTYFVVLGLKTYTGHKSYVILSAWGIVYEIMFKGEIAKNAKLIL